ncbi:MAG TPA: GNAT family N-acetyltransferase [Ornithinimicrobium sp.]|uniref:GNAT family N-acetyltransferase n=1 Tax=Ornithinimicrobium sp. TaxID=1977084 RepID=UPI002B45F7C1|nr:GNAT family N-acetyltransferase [Ornithinimicrobium sp.]HKJ11222.1 GNAT family N-acetyltransferase [Ornithinimicrobium sp.]
MELAIRVAHASDLTFLTQMATEAAFWDSGDASARVEELLAAPDLAHYVVGWPLPGDVGVVAEAGEPVGAAWFRYFSAEDPGYGFVDPAIPEVAIGVVPQWRGHGVGARLLAALIASAGKADVPALSLSVELDNPARRLYERCDFVPVEVAEGAVTMLLRL